MMIQLLEAFWISQAIKHKQIYYQNKSSPLK